MTDEELLAAMRAQYKYATLEDHMLINNIVYRRCRICRVRHVPHEAGSVIWCDPCLDECLETVETPEEFVTRKRAEKR